MNSKENNYGQCRCCLSKGHHRNILKEYNFKGNKEIYYNIFMECFNLYLSVNTNVSMLICLACIQRLRDAVDFRSSVAKAERCLLEFIDGNQTLFVNVSEEHTEESEKREKEHKPLVKEEPCEMEEDNSPGHHSDNDAAYCNETKEELPVVSARSEAALLARFPPRSLRRLPRRLDLYTIAFNYAMHLDTLKGRVILPQMIKQMVETNLTRSTQTNIQVKRSFLTEKSAHIHNTCTLIECSNVTPFKSKTRFGFPCLYCNATYDTLTTLRKHQNDKHIRSELKKYLRTLKFGSENFIVYVDVTDLRCTVCLEDIPSLTELKSHLTKVHKKRLLLNYTDRVIPFKCVAGKYPCQACGFTYETFGSIERHMNGHYRNYVCKECGTGFVTKYRLKVHVKSMHLGGSHPCDVCKKEFTSQQKYKNHFDTVHRLVKRFKCPKCPERFTEYFKRQKHMVELHNMAPLSYKCNVCERTFVRRYGLSRHMKRDHLEERDFACELCPYRCFTNNELRVHMIKHNGERIHECSVCKKAYARKKTLKEHMRIHNNDRRFACAVCGQSFVQKCSLKGHIKTHHLEYNMQ